MQVNKGNKENVVAPVNPNKLNYSERFTNKVLAEFGSNIAGALQVSGYQKYLIQGYFIKIDRALKTAEEARLAKKNSDNHLPATWENVNLQELALDVVCFSRMGLDMMQPNNLFPIPFRNKKTNKYDIALMLGYNGIRYVAEKYATKKFVNVIVELVYSNDVFEPKKKNVSNKIESYEFNIVKPFDRGEIIGGFGYIEYENPSENKLIIMTIEAILKRKPAYASPEFWGGEKDKWENGQRVGKTKIDGWFDEMCLKTLVREVFSYKHMPRDSRKIDADYNHMEMREVRIAEIKAETEILENANMIIVEPETPVYEVIEEENYLPQSEDEYDADNLSNGEPDTSDFPKADF